MVQSNVLWVRNKSLHRKKSVMRLCVYVHTQTHKGCVIFCLSNRVMQAASKRPTESRQWKCTRYWTRRTVPLPLPLSRILQVTVLYTSPPLVLFLASHPGVLPKYLQSLRYVVSGAAPLGSLDAERFLKRAPPNTEILQGSLWPLL